MNEVNDDALKLTGKLTRQMSSAQRQSYLRLPAGFAPSCRSLG